MCKTRTRQLLDSVFEETALIFGGLVATHEVDDDFIWQFAKALDSTRLKAIRKIQDETEKENGTPDERPVDLRPHPAIEELLIRIRRG